MRAFPLIDFGSLGQKKPASEGKRAIHTQNVKPKKIIVVLFTGLLEAFMGVGRTETGPGFR